jgi:hypothetical protein
LGIGVVRNEIISNILAGMTRAASG